MFYVQEGKADWSRLNDIGKITDGFMKISMATISILSCLLLFSCSVNSGNNEIETRGKNRMTTLRMEIIDTLSLDASRTSLQGKWLMNGDKLYFFDKNVVGIKEYSTSGKYLGEHIRHGRGPGEMLAPAWSSAIGKDNTIVIQDSNCQIWTVDSTFEKVSGNDQPWFVAVMADSSRLMLSALARNPDPKNPAMYDYNFNCGRMLSADGKLILPIVTEHEQYNGYNVVSNSRKFWKNSYTFISFDPEDIRGTWHLFGHYPAAYGKRNIPVFSNYDFTLDDDTLMVSFSADPAIYAYSIDSGELLYKFGHAEENIAGKYPSTKSYSQYESEKERQLARYGYYHSVFRNGDRTYRTCRSDDGHWHLQVYDGCDWLGSIALDGKIEIVGEHGGILYALAKENLERESFDFLLFRIRELGDS